MDDWDASSFIEAMGFDPADPDPWNPGTAGTVGGRAAPPPSPLYSNRAAHHGPPGPAATQAPHARSRSAPAAHGGPSAHAPTTAHDQGTFAGEPLDLTGAAPPRTGPAPNAQMLARALGANGELLDLWNGPAYFIGEMPTSYQGKLGGKGWQWTHNGEPEPNGSNAERLKIDSDAHGAAGRSVRDWAPNGTRSLTVDFVPLTAPFGAATSLPGEASPSGARAPFANQEADGSAPIAATTAVAVDGPRAPGTFREHGALTALDEAQGSTIWLGDSYVHLHGKPSEYLYHVAPQTSPRQRLLQITGTHHVAVEANDSLTGSVELVQQVRRVSQAELDALRLADSPQGNVLAMRSPEISASGDRWHVTLRIGRSAIHITALSAEARFAYYVDPEWRGNDRAVHIVATPGVRVDDAPIGGDTFNDDPRTLIANPIYVQDPRLVPQQGEPIEPSRYLGFTRHDNAPPGITPTAGNRAAFTVATGGSGITVRDAESGAALTIRAEDPTLGARYLHDVEGKQLRALVGAGARVEIVQRRFAPQIPHALGEAQDPYFDFGQVQFLIYQADRDDRFPDPGTPLTLETLQRFGHPKAPDSVEWVTPQKSPTEMMVELEADMGMTAVPGLGDVMDFVDLTTALTVGTDKWGNPLSRGEKIAVAVCALLPFVTAGGLLAAKRLSSLTRVGRAAAPLMTLARRIGRSEEEIQALLSTLRRLDDDAKAAARRIEQAVSLGDHINPADLAHLERSLTSVGFRISPIGARAGAHVAPHMGATAASAASSTTTRTNQLIECERDLQQALNKHTRTLGVRGAARRARVEVIPKVAFVEKFGSEQARAVFQMTERGPVIFARADAKAADMLDEAAHLAQLGDPTMAPSMRFLDERNLADWGSLSASDKFEFYQTKVEIEIDAKRRTLAAVRDESDRALAQAALADLERRQAEIAAITPEQLTRMNSGELPSPEYLDQAPRLFGKQRKVKEEITALHTRGPVGAAPEPRLVSREPGTPDYSSAYAGDGVEAVHQKGNSWHQSTYVTSDLDGVVSSRTVDQTGATNIIVSKGSTRRAHLFDPGAEVDSAIVPGRKVTHGERLGKDTSREYRSVDVVHADGHVVGREEIKSYGNGRSWVKRGTEATARGNAAEAAAILAADVDIAARVERKEIASAFHIPSKFGGGGFDDVIVEFSGEGEAMTAKVRIREVKDYANRHVSMAELSAIAENFDQNIRYLRADIEKMTKRAIMSDSGIDSGMSQVQLLLISKQLAREEGIQIELVLSASTKIGTGTHHATRVLPELRRRFPGLLVRRI